MTEFQEIALTDIRGPSVRDRLEVDEEKVSCLAQDIQANGLLNPILVRKNGDSFEVVAGERRFLAVQRLGWERVSCHVKVLDDETAAFLRAVENLGREDLTPIEEGRIYSALFKVHGVSLENIAKRMGKTVGVVRRRMDLLKMPSILQDEIHKRRITYGVAEELWRLADEGRISYYLGFAIDHGATVQVVRQWVNDELKAQRRQSADVEGGGGFSNPMEVDPTYISCSFCRGPVQLGKDTVLRACPECLHMLKEAGRG
ncbi:MAG: ParB/RepB/Spo0J family partition protein [Promethearchaeota archaeon]